MSVHVNRMSGTCTAYKKPQIIDLSSASALNRAAGATLQRNAGGLMCDGGAGRKISDQTDKQSLSVSHPD